MPIAGFEKAASKTAKVLPFLEIPHFNARRAQLFVAAIPNDPSAHGPVLVLGSNAALGRQWSRDYPIERLRFRGSPMVTFATKKLSTGTNEQKEDSDAASFFCPRSFDRVVIVDHTGKIVTAIFLV